MNEPCIEDLKIQVARLDERLKASDRALELAEKQLTTWKEHSNQWREENTNLRSTFASKEYVDGKFLVIEKSRRDIISLGMSFIAITIGIFDIIVRR